MKVGAILSVAVAAVAVGAAMVAFLLNASPYVTIAEAKRLDGSNLHVAAEIDKSTLRAVTGKEVRFTVFEEGGDRLNVVYDGPPPSNMGEAAQVVVIGGMRNGEFHATKMLLKCPTKYQGKPS